ncbi:ubiquitin related modifier 1 [Purpureocillium lilacinum]|uniref:Ubiquitin-related modifier 1 n=1 Tax=Purpureocillium lilacinum TaxID=33203 RepID=A0A179GHU3_PURLI|nr:ubiquitin related modifier 1 [Purpureocillium lilacinum]OAQ77436.1 ubiquitin related modifier 1 [Purpureocillium lilacinum]OAQ85553.1 ubiquitin related modifier 1 [Purpureocillium lilacinum]GJN75304.1 ubiquitin-modifier 1 [Purpureocillium lilacinum]GJN85913.1 ubiquitin modifier 1 [Purpureocillium lilacinum]
MAMATAEDVNGAKQLTISVEFSGGLEMLFSDQRHHSVTLPSEARNGHAADIAFLIDHLCDHVMKDTRKELFVLDGHIRPGVLVLINDADWELEGEEAYELQPGDNILFVSTLHGG